METRRNFLLQSAAALGLVASGRFVLAAPHAPLALTAREAVAQLAPEGYAKTAIWGYEGRAPGPAIRLRQGERVQRRLVNDLPEPTSVHWHGIRIANAMDGVSGLTQEAVAPGQAFDYDFVAPDAGTFWYHAHNRSWVQVARGLHGPLIVEEAEPPEVDREETLVLDDWLLDPETALIGDSFDQLMRMSHGGRIGNLITTNGHFHLSIPVQRNMRLRLRLINASNARIFPLQIVGLRGWTVALDGMPLAIPEPLENILVLAPAQRADLIVDVTAEAGETALLVRIGNDDRPASQPRGPGAGGRGTGPAAGGIGDHGDAGGLCGDAGAGGGVRVSHDAPVGNHALHRRQSGAEACPTAAALSLESGSALKINAFCPGFDMGLLGGLPSQIRWSIPI